MRPALLVTALVSLTPSDVASLSFSAPKGLQRSENPRARCLVVTATLKPYQNQPSQPSTATSSRVNPLAALMLRARGTARRFVTGLAVAIAATRILAGGAKATLASGISVAPAATAYRGSIILPACLWSSLFIFSASLHAAEIAITTLYPWKVQQLSIDALSACARNPAGQVREFAEDEGPNSPFAYLNDDITRVLTTVLVLTTVSQAPSNPPESIFQMLVVRHTSPSELPATTPSWC